MDPGNSFHGQVARQATPSALLRALTVERRERSYAGSPGTSNAMERRNVDDARRA